MGDSLGHFLVTGTRGSHVCHRVAAGLGQSLGESALARPRAPEHEDATACVYSVTVRGQTRSRSAVMMAFKSLTAWSSRSRWLTIT